MSSISLPMSVSRMIGAGAALADSFVRGIGNGVSEGKRKQGKAKTEGDDLEFRSIEGGFSWKLQSLP